MRIGIVIIAIGLAWCLGVRVRASRSVPAIQKVELKAAPVTLTLRDPPQAEPIAFNHCIFLANDAPFFNNGLPLRMILMSPSDGSATITIPKGKMVYVLIRDAPSAKNER